MKAAVVSALALFFAAGVPAAAAGARLVPVLPCGPTLDAPMGITAEVTRRSGEFGERDRAVQKMTSLGVGIVRVPMYWDVCFYEGTFRSGTYDAAMQTMNATPMRLLGTLSASYDRKTTAWSDPSAYLAYVRGVLSRYRFSISDWEVFPGIDDLWAGGRKVSAQQCFSTLKATSSLVRQSGGKVVLGCVGNVKGRFLDTLIAYGGHKFFDVMSFTSYGDPEGIVTQVNGIRRLMNKYGWEKPVWLTNVYYGSVPVPYTDDVFWEDDLSEALRILGVNPRRGGVAVVGSYDASREPVNACQTGKYLASVFGSVTRVTGDEVSAPDPSKVQLLVPGRLVSASALASCLSAGITVVLTEPRHPEVTHIGVVNHGGRLYLDDGNLSEGDAFLPIARDSEGVVCALYRLAAGGSVLVQTRRGMVPYFDSEAEQAKRLARCYILAYACGVEKVFWNGLRSKEQDSGRKSQYSGIYHSDFSDKPAAAAFSALSSRLSPGCGRPVVDIRDGLYVAKWTCSDGSVCHAVWRPAGTAPFSLKVTGKPVYSDHLGARIKGRPDFVSDGVIYITGASDVSF